MSVSEQDWLQSGTANEKQISVRALAYLMVVSRHHLQIIQNRYLNTA